MSARSVEFTVLLTFFALSHQSLAGNLNANDDRPNILVIVSDDQGYNDAGFQGGKEVPTPHLDALARSGVRCSNGYVTHPFCSPTRAALLTGRYQQRFGHEFNPVYDPLDENEGLPLNQRLLPEYLQDVGYKTGWIGKWHLGASPAHAPSKRGFEETFGFIGGGHRFFGWKPNERQYTLPLTKNGKSLDEVPAHLTSKFGEEASSFVRSHSDKPWFLYVAFNAPHTPHEPTQEREASFTSIENVARRKYLAQISLMDDAIGQILSTLTQTEQRNRTLVFFMSDNGGPVANGANNGPLRGTKGQLYEGGIRVPFLVSWPNRFPNESLFEAPVSSLDVFATSIAAAGMPMPSDEKFDGIDLTPFLQKESQKKSPPHERIFWRTQGKNLAIREGKWKLIRFEKGAVELYDLIADRGETQNLAAQMPDVVERMNSALDVWNGELVEPVFLGSSVKNEDWGPGGANQKNNLKALKTSKQF